MRAWIQWAVRVVGVGLALVPRVGWGAGALETRSTLVLAQPLYGPVGHWGASVEHTVGSHVALSGAVQFYMRLDDNRYDSGGGFSTRDLGLGVDPGVHFYLSGHAPEGFWIGPHLELSVFQHTSWTEVVSPQGNGTVMTDWRTLSYGGSARVGYTAILSPGLAVQVGLGLAVLHDRNTSSIPDTDGGMVSGVVVALARTEWSLSPRMMLGVGWAL